MFTTDIATLTDAHEHTARIAMRLLNEDPDVRILPPANMKEAGWNLKTAWAWRVYAWNHLVFPSTK